MTVLTISKLAEKTGISAETLRYYNKLRLIQPISRSPAGYRLYSADTVKIVRFIRGAKMLNFTLAEISNLLVLNASDKTICADVLKHTAGKITEAEAKIEELKELKKVLGQLVKACPGDDTSAKSCPILEHIQKGKALLLLAAMALGVAMPRPALAKPISYVDGIMAMQENDETGNTLSLDYTINPKLAVGLYAKKENGGKEFRTLGPQVNTLWKRWNLPDGQGNIFNQTGVGIANYHGNTRPAAWTGFLADYETRRIFTSYEIKLTYADDIEKSAWQRARIGVAAYLANYDDLNTWFMVQVDHHPAKDETLVVTPLVRFFYKTTLVEAGYSSNNHVMLNWVLQF